MEKEVWYTKPIKEVLTGLNTTETGLSTAEAAKRLKEKGPNVITQEKRISVLGIFLRQFKENFVVYILIFAGVVSFIMGDKAEFVVIMVIIGFIIVLGFFEEYKASKEMDALKRLTPQMAKVYRDGKVAEIFAKDIVPGDVIDIERGMIVPADAMIIQCNNLHADESTLTGESVPVVKNDTSPGKQVPLAEQYNMVFASSQIANGNGKVVVIATAKDTEIGKVSAMIKGVEEETTPLQKRLDKLSKQISYSRNLCHNTHCRGNQRDILA